MDGLKRTEIQVERAARHAAPWIERLARAGYAARGVVYLVVAFLAARAALRGTAPGGTDDAMSEVNRSSGGEWALALLALGLLGFAAWRFVQAAMDPEGTGSAGKRAVGRIRHAASGLIHVGLALAAARMALGEGGRGGDRWFSTALSPLGRTAIWIAAAGFAAYGAYQLYRAYRVDLDDQLDLSRMRPEGRVWTVRAGRAGLAARGVVFAIVGVLLTQAARYRSEESPGLEGALRTLQEQPFGVYLLGLIALGLAGYGAFELVRARYRRIRTA